MEVNEKKLKKLLLRFEENVDTIDNNGDDPCCDCPINFICESRDCFKETSKWLGVTMP